MTSIDIHYNDDGHLRLVGWGPEPICPICGHTIRWCLDMLSFTTGFNTEHPFTLAHAHCVWTKEAFKREARKAVSHQ